MAASEAGVISREGQRNVIITVLNRVESSEFPDTIHDVVFQSGQFAVVRNGSYKRVVVDDELKAFVREVYLDYIDEEYRHEALYFGRGKTGGSQYLFTDEVKHVFYK